MRDLLRILAPLLLWLASFSAIYGLHGVGCAQGWAQISLGPLTLFRSILIAAWLLAVLAQFALLWGTRSWPFGPKGGFARRTGMLTGWTAVVATIWTLQPVVATTSCG